MNASLVFVWCWGCIVEFEVCSTYSMSRAKNLQEFAACGRDLILQQPRVRVLSVPFEGVASIASVGKGLRKGPRSNAATAHAKAVKVKGNVVGKVVKPSVVVRLNKGNGGKVANVGQVVKVPQLKRVRFEFVVPGKEGGKAAPGVVKVAVSAPRIKVDRQGRSLTLKTRVTVNMWTVSASGLQVDYTTSWYDGEVIFITPDGKWMQIKFDNITVNKYDSRRTKTFHSTDIKNYNSGVPGMGGWAFLP